MMNSPQQYPPGMLPNDPMDAQMEAMQPQQGGSFMDALLGGAMSMAPLALMMLPQAAPLRAMMMARGAMGAKAGLNLAQRGSQALPPSMQNPMQMGIMRGRAMMSPQQGPGTMIGPEMPRNPFQPPR